MFPTIYERYENVLSQTDEEITKSLEMYILFYISIPISTHQIVFFIVFIGNPFWDEAS